MTAAPIHCRWCGRACRPRRGGSPRVFCTSGCRNAFHAAARRWAERAIAAGMLTIAELRNGDPAACTLLSGRLCGAEISEAPAGRTGARSQPRQGSDHGCAGSDDGDATARADMG